VTLALFAAALLAFVVALLTLSPSAGLFVRGRDRVEAGADDRPSGLGRAAHDGGGPADDRADQAALKHQAAAKNDDDLRDGNEAISTTHEDDSRDLE
jgi:hypothetical protein